MHLPTYAGLFKVNVSLTLCTAIRSSLNILELTYVGFEVSLSSFFSLVTSLTSTLLRKFSIVFPKTILFISLKKSFSNEFLACFHFSVLKSIYCLSQGDLSNFSTRWTSLFSDRDLSRAGGYDSAIRTLSCLLMLE